MQYFLTFLEGLIAFLSPCVLPLLPVYISYFAGSTAGRRGKTLFRALLFVLGFSLVFSLMGLFAGTLGGFFAQHRMLVNLVCGIFIIIFGLSYLEILPLSLPNIALNMHMDRTPSAFLLGMVFAVCMSPCTGAFLGSALMMASAAGSSLQGLLLLVFYALGMGVPYLISALLIDSLMGFFNSIKRHYALVRRVSGLLLILIGILMITGKFTQLMTFSLQF